MIKYFIASPLFIIMSAMTVSALIGLAIALYKKQDILPSIGLGMVLGPVGWLIVWFHREGAAEEAAREKKELMRQMTRPYRSADVKLLGMIVFSGVLAFFIVQPVFIYLERHPRSALIPLLRGLGSILFARHRSVSPESQLQGAVFFVPFFSLLGLSVWIYKRFLRGRIIDINR
ncbi:MAG: hypothetical protein WCG78_00080 [Candidatus Omnitrophota bacterium]